MAGHWPVNAGSLGLVETLIGWPWSERSIRPHIILRRVAIVKDQRESEVRGSVDSKLTGGLTCDNDEAVWRIVSAFPQYWHKWGGSFKLKWTGGLKDSPAATRFFFVVT
jgi:hypothetical protein